MCLQMDWWRTAYCTTNNIGNECVYRWTDGGQHIVHLITVVLFVSTYGGRHIVQLITMVLFVSTDGLMNTHNNSYGEYSIHPNHLYFVVRCVIQCWRYFDKKNCIAETKYTLVIFIAFIEYTSTVIKIKVIAQWSSMVITLSTWT